MNKILVDVFLPAVNRSFDIYIPDSIRFHEVISMINKAVSSLCDGRFIPSDDTVLCDRNTGVIFDINLNSNELCLHNGSKLMLI